jgi:hypothetical protein
MQLVKNWQVPGEALADVIALARMRGPVEDGGCVLKVSFEL